jgi:hypothetical protein
MRGGARFLSHFGFLCARGTRAARVPVLPPYKRRKKCAGVRDFCPIFASFVRAGHEPLASPYCHLKETREAKYATIASLKVAVRSAIKSDKIQYKKKKMRGGARLLSRFCFLCARGTRTAHPIRSDKIQ